MKKFSPLILLLFLLGAAYPGLVKVNFHPPPLYSRTDPQTGYQWNIPWILEDDKRANGEVIVSPFAEAIAGQRANFTFIFTVGKKGIHKDGGIIIVFPGESWSLPQTESYLDGGFLNVSVNRPGAYFQIKALIGGTTQKPKRTRNEYAVILEKVDLKEGDVITIEYLNTIVQPTTGYVEFPFYVDHDGDCIFQAIPQSPHILITSDYPDAIQLIAPSQIEFGKTFDLFSIALDKFGNQVENFKNKMSLSIEGGKSPESLSHRALLTEAGIHRWKIVPNSTGFVRCSIIDETSKKTFSSNPIFCYDYKQDYLRYWGDIHFHSSFSDSFVQSSPQELFKYARDVSRLDFAALTDHDVPMHSDPLNEEKWNTIRNAVMEFNKEGEFIVFLGYEWTSGYKDWKGFGHRTIIFKDFDGSFFRADTPNSDHILELYSLLEPLKAIIIPHHPMVGWAPMNWEYHNPGLEPLVEIFSSHGSSEKPNSEIPVEQAVPAASVQNALAKGYVFGFIASSDGHYAHPGFNCRDKYKPISLNAGGLTCVLATELTRESLWDAFVARRCYATTGARIWVDFRINGQVMGTIIQAEKRPQIEVKVAATEPLICVEIVRFGPSDPIPFPIVKRFNTRKLYFHTKWSDNNYRENSLYYLVVKQQDGEMAWTSPIWVISDNQSPFPQIKR